MAGNGAGLDLRLRPEMASRRLQVYAFVREYIATWGGSPSIGEIAAGVGISRTRVFELLRRLARDGLLIRRGGPRGLALPEERDAAIRALRAQGYVVVGGTHSHLLDAPALTYPGPSGGADGAGKDDRADEDGAAE